MTIDQTWSDGLEHSDRGQDDEQAGALAGTCHKMLIFVLSLLDIPRQSTSQQKTIKEQIVGTWLLDTVYDQLQDGKKNDTWGPGVKGIALFDGSGHMSIQIVAADRAKSEVLQLCR